MEIDFPKNHCMFCKHFSLTPNEEPCKECMETGEIPGRDRLLFVSKDEKNSNIPLDNSLKPLIFKERKIVQKSLF